MDTTVYDHRRIKTTVRRPENKKNVFGQIK